MEAPLPLKQRNITPTPRAMERLLQLASDPSLHGSKLQALAQYAEKHVERVRHQLTKGRSAVSGRDTWDRQEQLDKLSTTLLATLADNPNTPVALLQRFMMNPELRDRVLQNPVTALHDLESPGWIYRGFDLFTLETYLHSPSKRDIVVKGLGAPIYSKNWKSGVDGAEMRQIAQQAIARSHMENVWSYPHLDVSPIQRIDIFRWNYFPPEEVDEDVVFVRGITALGGEVWQPCWPVRNRIEEYALRDVVDRAFTNYFMASEGAQWGHRTVSIIKVAARALIPYLLGHGHEEVNRLSGMRESQETPHQWTDDDYRDVLIEQRYLPQVRAPKAAAMAKIKAMAARPDLPVGTIQKLLKAFDLIKGVDPRKGDELFQTIAQNPNLSAMQLADLIDRYPEHALQNSALTLMGLGDPHWLKNTYNKGAMLRSLLDPATRSQAHQSLSTPTERYTFRKLRGVSQKVLAQTGLDAAPRVLEAWHMQVPDDSMGDDFSVLRSEDARGEEHWAVTEGSRVSETDKIRGWGFPKDFPTVNAKCRRFGFHDWENMIFTFIDQNFDEEKMRHLYHLVSPQEKRDFHESQLTTSRGPLRKREVVEEYREVVEDYTGEMAKLMKVGPSKLTFKHLASIHQAAGDPTLDGPSQDAIVNFLIKRGGINSDIGAQLLSNPNLLRAHVLQFVTAHPDALFQNPQLFLWTLEDPNFWGFIDKMTSEDRGNFFAKLHQTGLLDQLATSARYTFKNLATLSSSPRYAAQYSTSRSKMWSHSKRAAVEFGLPDTEYPRLAQILPESLVVWSMPNNAVVLVEAKYPGKPVALVVETSLSFDHSLWLRTGIKELSQLLRQSDQNWY